MGAQPQAGKKNNTTMAETKRQKQVAELVKRNFSMVLQQEGIYIYGAQPLVTVTVVKVTPDLSQAKIYVSVFNTDNKQAVILQMDNEVTRLRQALANRVKKHMRRVPEIAFYVDETLDEMETVDRLFTNLHAEGQMGEPEEEGADEEDDDFDEDKD